MIEKTKEKIQAIKLRREGLSYNEILKRVPVAKSTLSLWLRSVGLAKRQKQRLTKKRLAGALRGAMVKRSQRITITKEIKKKARKEIGELSKRELWLIGTALYWGEGQKERTRGALIGLGNSDPNLIKIFLKWLKEICKIPRQDILFRIFLHETAKNRLSEVKNYWSTLTGFPINNFQKITWKKNKINTKRKNIGKDYYGLLRVIVRRSTNLNRKVEGWIEGIYKNCGVV
ncbi:MAG: hypothetical protein ACE5WD_12345 [Candidatus Aminicenantia bacterium]